jgi:hypothetical protein
MSSNEWRERAQDNRDFQDFEWNTDMKEKFETRLGDISHVPDRSEYPQRIEGLMVRQYLNMSNTRKSIIVGKAESSTHDLVKPAFIPTPTQHLVQPSIHPFGKGSKVDRPHIALEPLSARISAASPKPPLEEKNFLNPFAAIPDSSLPSLAPSSPVQDDSTKRAREPSSTTPSPAQQSVIRPKVDIIRADDKVTPSNIFESCGLSAPEEKQPTTSLVEAIELPVPTVPTLPSSFDLLAMELDDISISPDPGSSIQPTAMEDVMAPISSVTAKLVQEEITAGIDHMRELKISHARSKFIALKCLIAWRTTVRESSKLDQLVSKKTPIRI